MTREGYTAGLEDNITHLSLGAQPLEAGEKSSSLGGTVEEGVGIHPKDKREKTGDWRERERGLAAEKKALSARCEEPAARQEVRRKRTRCTRERLTSRARKEDDRSRKWREIKSKVRPQSWSLHLCCCPALSACDRTTGRLTTTPNIHPHTLTFPWTSPPFFFGPCSIQASCLFLWCPGFVFVGCPFPPSLPPGGSIAQIYASNIHGQRAAWQGFQCLSRRMNSWVNTAAIVCDSRFQGTYLYPRIETQTQLGGGSCQTPRKFCQAVKDVTSVKSSEPCPFGRQLTS